MTQRHRENVCLAVGKQVSFIEAKAINPMISTMEWAQSFGISVEANPAPLAHLSEPYPRTALEIAGRAVILQCIVSAAWEVDPEALILGLQDEGIWEAVSPAVKILLLENRPSAKQRNAFRWRQEAEWTLLWMIGKVEALGLPTQTCDTRHMVDEIIPALGSDITEFVASAELRHPEILYAEDECTYDLWCRAIPARRENMLPYDLNMDVLYERRYAFEWADSTEQWDKITCDE